VFVSSVSRRGPPTRLVNSEIACTGLFNADRTGVLHRGRARQVRRSGPPTHLLAPRSGRCFPFRFEEENRHGRFTQHALRIAAEEQPVQSSPTVRAHDDKVGKPGLRLQCDVRRLDLEPSGALRDNSQPARGALA
jgi:hypothetical protein